MVWMIVFNNSCLTAPPGSIHSVHHRTSRPLLRLLRIHPYPHFEDPGSLFRSHRGVYAYFGAGISTTVKKGCVAESGLPWQI